MIPEGEIILTINVYYPAANEKVSLHLPWDVQNAPDLRLHSHHMRCCRNRQCFLFIFLCFFFYICRSHITWFPKFFGFISCIHQLNSPQLLTVFPFCLLLGLLKVACSSCFQVSLQLKGYWLEMGCNPRTYWKCLLLQLAKMDEWGFRIEIWTI